jgi:hypothetical protein
MDVELTRVEGWCFRHIAGMSRIRAQGAWTPYILPTTLCTRILHQPNVPNQLHHIYNMSAHYSLHKTSTCKEFHTLACVKKQYKNRSKRVRKLKNGLISLLVIPELLVAM